MKNVQYRYRIPKPDDKVDECEMVEYIRHRMEDGNTTVVFDIERTFIVTLADDLDGIVNEETVGILLRRSILMYFQDKVSCTVAQYLGGMTTLKPGER